MSYIQQLDEQIVLWVSENLQHDILNPLMIGVSVLGNMGVIFILAGVFMIIMGTRNAINWRQRGILLLTCLAVTALFANLFLKPFVARIRPYDLLGLSLLIPPLHDFSFPSGHTAAAFATGVVFLSFHRMWGIALLIFAVLMGFSRLYLLVHFPSDIIFGALLGTVVSSFIIYFWKNNVNKKHKGQ